MVLLGIVDFELHLPTSQRRILTEAVITPTFFSEGLSNENLPNRTWKGEHASEPTGF